MARLNEVPVPAPESLEASEYSEAEYNDIQLTDNSKTKIHTTKSRDC